MADANLKVAYLCQWCGRSFHELTDDHSMHPVAIYNDFEGRQYCTWYCFTEGTEYYNEDEMENV